MSIKGHRDQIGRDFWRETFGERPLERHTSGLRHTVTPQISGVIFFFFFHARVQCTSLIHTQNTSNYIILIYFDKMLIKAITQPSSYSRSRGSAVFLYT